MHHFGKYDTHHMETLIGKFPSLFPRCRIDAGSLPVLIRSTQDRSNSFLEIFMHATVEDRVADVVPKIEWTDEEDIDAWNLRNCIYL